LRTTDVDCVLLFPPKS